VARCDEFRRGPGPDCRYGAPRSDRAAAGGLEPADADLQRERLREQPSWWYLTGYIAPIQDLGDERLLSDAEIQEETETEVGDLVEDEGEEIAGGGAADDDSPPEAPATRRRFAPSSPAHG
jgi:hypothetical protein